MSVSSNKTAPLEINKTNIEFEGKGGYKVNLTFEAKDLKDVENFGQIDPVCILLQYELKDVDKDGDLDEFEWVEKGRTEMIKNSQSPKFTTPIQIQFTFQVQQDMKVLFVHGDEQKPIGQMCFNMGNVMGGPTEHYEGTLTEVKSEEETEVNAEPSNESHGTVMI